MLIEIDSDELDWLLYFHDMAEFGPAGEDVRLIIQEDFEEVYNKRVPEKYRMESDE